MCKNISLSEEQKQLVYASLLGDGYFNFEKDCLKITHSQKEKEYFDWKYSLLEITSKVYKREQVNIFSPEKIFVSYSLEIRKNRLKEILSFLHHTAYSKTSHRKKISPSFLNALNPLGLAVWWMDDGNLANHKGNRWGKLSTNAFNYEEHLIMQKYFKEKWDIDVDIKQEKGKYYFLRFNVTGLQKLFKIIYSYVCMIPSMIYKIDLNYQKDVNLNHFVENFEDVYNYIKKQQSCLETTGDIQ